MVIKPRTWGFICTNAHPLGCDKNVADQIAATRQQGTRDDGPKNVLVIGASTGYGLAARISAAFGFGAATIGVFFEKPARKKRTASAGWYNAAAFDRYAKQAGLKAVSINADAFADATREQVIDSIREHMGGPVDLVIYSLASPQRRMPDSGEVVKTTLKPVGQAFSGPTINTDKDCLTEVSLEAATDADTRDTIAVMGGDDWSRWIHALNEAHVLADNAQTVAFSYIGPDVTWPIYRDGTIGHAKADLENTAQQLSTKAQRPDFARVAILKSIVTQASAAIPVIPLYISLVFKAMKARGVHETAIDQQNRLFRDKLYPATHAPAPGRLRLDERELDPAIQAECARLWPQVNDDNLFELTDYTGYKRAFLNLFGFARDDVDYDADVDPNVEFDGTLL